MWKPRLNTVSCIYECWFVAVICLSVNKHLMLSVVFIVSFMCEPKPITNNDICASQDHLLTMISVWVKTIYSLLHLCEKSILGQLYMCDFGHLKINILYSNSEHVHMTQYLIPHVTITANSLREWNPISHNGKCLLHLQIIQNTSTCILIHFVVISWNIQVGSTPTPNINFRKKCHHYIVFNFTSL